MTDYRREYPRLADFLGAYFTPDWKELYDWRGATPSFEAIVQFYKSEHPRIIVDELIIELQAFLALPLIDKELEEIVNDVFIAWYTPRSRGLTKRQWLTAMIPLLQEPTQLSSLQLKK